VRAGSRSGRLTMSSTSLNRPALRCLARYSATARASVSSRPVTGSPAPPGAGARPLSCLLLSGVDVNKAATLLQFYSSTDLQFYSFYASTFLRFPRLLKRRHSAVLRSATLFLFVKGLCLHFFCVSRAGSILARRPGGELQFYSSTSYSNFAQNSRAKTVENVAAPGGRPALQNAPARRGVAR